MSAFNRLLKLERKRPLIIGMVHLKALPGSPLNSAKIDEISKIAVDEALTYAEIGLNGIILENMGDVPYVQSSSPETVAFMTRCALDIKTALQRRLEENEMILGIHTLASRNKEALAIALAAGFDFIRCEGFVFAHVADEGFTNACAGELLRFRRNIGAQNIAVFADLKKKHSAHSITSDVSLLETAEAAKYFQADGVVVTGSATGRPTNPNDVKEIKQGVHKLPIFVGSGVNGSNAKDYLEADGLIVGSCFKYKGYWANDLDYTRVNDFMETFRNLSV